MLQIFIAVAVISGSLTLAACGSSGGTDNPPAPPAPVSPPPPPPAPEPPAYSNACQAKTPGFERLGADLEGRELGRSRVWMADANDAHRAEVWAAFTACAVRSDEALYAPFDRHAVYGEVEKDGRDLILSLSLSAPYEDVPLPAPDFEYFDGRPYWNGARADGQRVLEIRSAGNGDGQRTGHVQRAFVQAGLARADTTLWIIVGGYVEGPDGPEPASGVALAGGGTSGSSLCAGAGPLCLFAPWAAAGRHGTSISVPQVSAALDAVWARWPDMDVLDLRNLAFDCARFTDAEAAGTLAFTYSGAGGLFAGGERRSRYGAVMGHGVLSLSCLFTANGPLRDPVTGGLVSGGIFGPMAGPVAGASITGVDYTGRDFGYGFARPAARENFALAATANVSAVQAISGFNALGRGPGAFRAAAWAAGPARIEWTAVGNAIGAAAQWQANGLTLRAGLAVQPEGVGSLTGSRAFRSPSTVSAAITMAYGRAIGAGLSAHLQADHWGTLATRGRSLWEDAQLSESRISAALVKRLGRYEFALQGVWRSGLSGTLDVDGRSWAVAPRAERGLWLTWRKS